MLSLSPLTADRRLLHLSVHVKFVLKTKKNTLKKVHDREIFSKYSSKAKQTYPACFAIVATIGFSISR